MPSQTEQVALLQVFPNPSPSRPFEIYHEQPEFTSKCPMTGHPDFGTIRLWYQPAAICVELKSLKLYYQAFRDQGIFYEAVTNRIADDLAGVLKPTWLKIESDWRPRGGMSTIIRVEIGKRAS